MFYVDMKRWERGHILSLILSYKNISNCSKIHCKCAGGPCLGSFWQSGVFCVQPFFFWRRKGGRASLELREGRDEGQSREEWEQSVSASREERGWSVKKNINSKTSKVLLENVLGILILYGISFSPINRRHKLRWKLILPADFEEGKILYRTALVGLLSQAGLGKVFLSSLCEAMVNLC